MAGRTRCVVTTGADQGPAHIRRLATWMGQTSAHAHWSRRSGAGTAVIEVPRTAYALLGEDRIAYQVFGEGTLDLIWFPGSADCIDLRWD